MFYFTSSVNNHNRDEKKLKLKLILVKYSAVNKIN